MLLFWLTFDFDDELARVRYAHVGERSTLLVRLEILDEANNLESLRDRSEYDVNAFTK